MNAAWARRLLGAALALIIAASLGAQAVAEHAALGFEQAWPQPDDGVIEYVQGDRLYFLVPVSRNFAGEHRAGLTAPGTEPAELCAPDGRIKSDVFLYTASYVYYAELDTANVEPDDYRFYFVDVYSHGLGSPRPDFIWQDVRILPAETPSGWAEDYAAEAISRGLVPLAIQNRYTSAITRDDFSKLIVAFLERKTGFDIAELLRRLGPGSQENPFSDVNDAAEDFQDHILAAYSLGIVNGRGDGTFDPAGIITREEAATMLRRAAAVTGYSAALRGAGYADMDEVSEWAVSGVNFVTATGIMNGISATEFGPSEVYSYEQAYTTMVRMLNVVSN